MNKYRIVFKSIEIRELFVNAESKEEAMKSIPMNDLTESNLMGWDDEEILLIEKLKR